MKRELEQLKAIRKIAIIEDIYLSKKFSKEQRIFCLIQLFKEEKSFRNLKESLETVNLRDFTLIGLKILKRIPHLNIETIVKKLNLTKLQKML